MPAEEAGDIDVVEVDALVVGDGLPGLVAAHRLADAGLDVRVVAWPPVPTSAASGPTGAVALHPGDHRLAALLSALRVPVAPAPAAPRRDSTGGPRWSAADRWDARRLRREVDRRADDVPLEAPWLAPGAVAAEQTSLAHWLVRRRARARVRQEVIRLTRRWWATDPDELSLLDGWVAVRSAGGVVALLDRVDGRGAATVDGCALRTALLGALRHAVVRGPVALRWSPTVDDERGVPCWSVVEVTTAAGARLRGRHGVLAGAAARLSGLPLEPGPPADVAAAATSLRETAVRPCGVDGPVLLHGAGWTTHRSALEGPVGPWQRADGGLARHRRGTAEGAVRTGEAAARALLAVRGVEAVTSRAAPGGRPRRA